MEANDPEALEVLLVQLKQIVNSASSAQLWAKPPIIDSSYDENGDLVETQENDTPGLRRVKMSVSKEVEGIENVSQLCWLRWPGVMSVSAWRFFLRLHRAVPKKFPPNDP